MAGQRMTALLGKTRVTVVEQRERDANGIRTGRSTFEVMARCKAQPLASFGFAMQDVIGRGATAEAAIADAAKALGLS